MDEGKWGRERESEDTLQNSVPSFHSVGSRNQLSHQAKSSNGHYAFLVKR